MCYKKIVLIVVGMWLFVAGNQYAPLEYYKSQVTTASKAIKEAAPVFTPTTCYLACAVWSGVIFMHYCFEKISPREGLQAADDDFEYKGIWRATKGLLYDYRLISLVAKTYLIGYPLWLVLNNRYAK